MTHAAKKYPKVICQGLISVIFKREFLNLLNDWDPWSWGFKIEFFQFVSNCRGRLYQHGFGSTSENQQCKFCDAIFVRCCFCEMSFLWEAIYVGRHFYEVVFLIRAVPFLQHCVNECHKCKVALAILTKYLC